MDHVGGFNSRRLHSVLLGKSLNLLDFEIVDHEQNRLKRAYSKCRTIGMWSRVWFHVKLSGASPC